MNKRLIFSVFIGLVIIILMFAYIHHSRMFPPYTGVLKTAVYKKSFGKPWYWVLTFEDGRVVNCRSGPTTIYHPGNTYRVEYSFIHETIVTEWQNQ